MSADIEFSAASKRAEAWLGLVHAVADLGQRGSVNPAYELLQVLHNDYLQHSDALKATFEQLAAISDSPIAWGSGRGWNGILGAGGTVSCWSSAHEAAESIAAIALEALYWPLEGISEPTEQFSVGSRLLAGRSKALLIEPDELAALQERVRRERAKLSKPARSQDDEWTEAKAPAVWRKELNMSETSLRQYIKNGILVVDKVTTKKWRFRKDSLRRFVGDK